VTTGDDGNHSGNEPRYSNKKKPWCQNCGAHRKISVKGGQKSCSQCGEKGIFIPQNKYRFELGFFLTAGFFGFLSKEGMESGEGWTILLILPAIFFTVLGARCQQRYSAWSSWSKKKPDSDGGKTADRKRKRRRKKIGKKQGKPRSFKPPTREPSSPPPAPPPLPPDANSG